MNHLERAAVRRLHTRLVEIINPDYLVDFLYENGVLDQTQVSDYSEQKLRSVACRQLLFQLATTCSMNLFLDCLRFKNCYDFLAEELEETIKDIREASTHEEENSLGCNDFNDFSSKADGGEGEYTEQIIPLPRKINVFMCKSKREKLIRWEHVSKCHLYEEKQDIWEKMKQKAELEWANGKHLSVSRQMFLADLLFRTWDVEIRYRRIKYDQTLDQSDAAFKRLETLIKFTSQPAVSTMMYLSRLGSTFAMKSDSLERGMEYLYYARQHAESVAPCKETGGVLYIYFYLLAQIYEKNPQPHMRQELLKRAQLAIEHFSEEDENIRIVYKRMFLLKMAFIHLGIGFLGNLINPVSVQESDIQAAKTYLDNIELPEYWKGLECQRKMYFFIAKAVYHIRKKQPEFARMNAEKAFDFARGRYIQHISNIEKLVKKIEQIPNQPVADIFGGDIDDFISEIFTDECAEKRENKQNTTATQNGRTQSLGTSERRPIKPVYFGCECHYFVEAAKNVETTAETILEADFIPRGEKRKQPYSRSESCDNGRLPDPDQPPTKKAKLDV